MNKYLILNILFSSSIYSLISLGLHYSYTISRFLKLSFAAYISLASYLVYSFTHLGINILISILLSLLSIGLLSFFFEKYIFTKIRERNQGFTVSLITSLGIYILLQNSISLIWGEDTKSLSNIVSVENLTNVFVFRYISIGITILCFILTFLFLYRSKTGLYFRSIESNPLLAEIFGVKSNRVFLLSSFIGACLCGISGLIIAFDTNFNPHIGFPLLVYGVAIMIIGGKGSIIGILFGSVLLALLQHLIGYYIDSKWMDAIAYIILILFLIWKPLGFSGKRLKKIEI